MAMNGFLFQNKEYQSTLTTFREVNSGSKLDLTNDAKPIDFLQKLIAPKIMDSLIGTINAYAEVINMINSPLTKYSCLHQWKPIGRVEFLRFLAVIII